ncbi:hypothetical protein ANCCAN_13099 [Ancylostoma caninum]|uniref:Uncharacterized protein n=1 Tax=Ancylostoma caninum TaxID=29170 RepID=A0A368GDU2_ANCCA|nr:hypothetical protein ANCCAN_13099 [Ancylostoma caninum]
MSTDNSLQALKEYEAAWAQYYASLGQTVPAAPTAAPAPAAPGGPGEGPGNGADYSGYYANGAPPPAGPPDAKEVMANAENLMLIHFAHSGKP